MPTCVNIGKRKPHGRRVGRPAGGALMLTPPSQCRRRRKEDRHLPTPTTVATSSPSERGKSFFLSQQQPGNSPANERLTIQPMRSHNTWDSQFPSMDFLLRTAPTFLCKKLSSPYSHDVFVVLP